MSAMAKEYMTLCIQRNRSQTQPYSQHSKKAAVATGTGIGIGEVNKLRETSAPPNKQQNFNQNKSASLRKMSSASFLDVNPSVEDMKVST